MYLLSVSYLFDEFDPAVDDAINLQVGKRSSASGAGFGERDLEFDFEDRDEAMAAMNRIKTHVPGATCLITANTPEHRLLEQILFDEMDALNSETFMGGAEVAIECAICGAPIVATMTVRVVPDGQGTLMITDFSPAHAVWACQGGHPHDTAAMLERYRDFIPVVPWEDEPYVGESVHDWKGPTVVCVLGLGVDADRDARIVAAVGEELAVHRRARESLTSLTFILPDRPHALAARVRVREADPNLRVTLNVAPDGVSILDLADVTEPDWEDRTLVVVIIDGPGNGEKRAAIGAAAGVTEVMYRPHQTITSMAYVFETRAVAIAARDRINQIEPAARVTVTRLPQPGDPEQES